MTMRKSTGAVTKARAFASTAVNLTIHDNATKRCALDVTHNGRHVIIAASPRRPDTTLTEVMTLFCKVAQLEDLNKQYKVKVEMLDRKITVQF